ncbi:Leucine Rich Repeat [Seminavis robusta]|uniref:Leucine Rich Repeat n=1 Tax=Seminavis robusta TaxID=568900 RepID=A0A9N8HFW3_9STRA|nr:Leucine Rich Repeat [Seminavis robusta]|eukprot:Sro543_g163590.1 Leucine Rich Repeat (1303) ;mRNA; f:39386-43791
MSVSTIGTPMSFRQGRPPRFDSPASRKRRATSAAAGMSTPSGHDSIGGSSELSSGQLLRPTHSFTGGMDLFGGQDDDLDNFAKYIVDEDDDDEDDDDEESGQEMVASRVISFESDEESPGRHKEKGGMMRLFRFDRRRKKKPKQKTSAGSQEQSKQQQQYNHNPPLPPTTTNHQPFHHPPPQLLVHQSAPPALISPHNHLSRSHNRHSHHLPPTPYPMPRQHQPYQLPYRPQSSLSWSRPTPVTTVPRDEHENANPTEIRCDTPAIATQRSRSLPDYRTYNDPKSTTLPRMGSFGMGIDTIPASPKMATFAPFTQDEAETEEEEQQLEEDQIILRTPSWKSSSSMMDSVMSTAMVPYASGIELVDQEGTPQIDRTDSWNRRLERTDIYHRHYMPSRLEIGELQELEDYLGIFSAKTKHRFSTLWRHLVPPLDYAVSRQQRSSRRSLSQASASSMSDLSSVTGQQLPVSSKSKSSSTFYSIVLKRGPVQFEEYNDYHCEWILLTRGFVVARPNYQYIPRFQAGDLWASVVQVEPTNPLSITLSCTSRAASTHLTLTQLKQQQQYGCYTYQLSCRTPQEQASWLEALRKVVVQAHDSTGTNEKEMGGLGWQYRVVYVPFFTEAVTGDPIQKEKILAGSTGHVDLNALDSYNSYAPMHYATRANHVRVMRFLLEAGADVHVGDGYGRTPMYYAELHQLPEATIQMLEAHGAGRSKKPASMGLSRKAWRRRSCRLRLIILALILLLLACLAGGLLWHFGMLESLGIGSSKQEEDVGVPDASQQGEVFGIDDAEMGPVVVTDEWSEATREDTAPPTAAPVVSPSPSSSQPSSPLPTGIPEIQVAPPLVSRGEETATPYPTRSPSYIKTPLPTPQATTIRQIPATDSPSFTPSSSAFDTALFRLLASASFDAGAALRVPDSPQQRAFFWLHQNANIDSYTNSRKIQRYALATFYYSTNGDNWAENLWWLSDEDECTWYNKQVANGYPACQINTSNSAQRTFTSLDLSFNNVQGTIPPELGLLSGLLRLDLDGGPAGFLFGTLPPELGYLDSIQSFSARGNQLTGTVPEDIGNWRQVTGIDLSFNKLTGLMPSTIGSLTWLSELTLEMNELSGVLPVELGQLSNLFKLAIGGNQFQGPLMSEIGSLTKLRYLYIEVNQFSSLPTDIGRLENLNVLSAFENNFQGALPTELGRLTKLGSLLLRSNAFSASMPSELGSMDAIQRSLYLQSNKLSGAIPNELSSLSQLNTLRVESNDIGGIVPSAMCTIFNTTFPNFYADCASEVSCSCCTYCCVDDGGCECQYADTNAYLC